MCKDYVIGPSGTCGLHLTCPEQDSQGIWDAPIYARSTCDMIVALLLRRPAQVGTWGVFYVSSLSLKDAVTAQE